MILHRIRAFSLVFIALTLATTAALAQQLPPLSGRVIDNAEMMSPAIEDAITRKLAAHETKTGNQIVVYTVPDLGGRTIEEEALRLLRGWGLGQADLNNGVLLMIARDDRKIRIETGYGVEGTLTDAIASLIIRNIISPAFKRGYFDVGIQNGLDRMIEVLEADEAALQAWKDRATPEPVSEWETDPIGLIFFTLWGLIFFGPILLTLMIRTFGKKIKPGHYEWLGMEAGRNSPGAKARRKRRRSSGSSSSGWGGGFSSGGGGFSGGGGSGGGGGASGGW